MGSASKLPLSALLSQVFTAHAIELDNEFEHRAPHQTTLDGVSAKLKDRPWLTSVAMYFNCLKYVAPAPISLREMTQRAGLHTNVDGVQRWGYVTIESRTKAPGPASVLHATNAGKHSAAVWETVFPDVEARWRERLGPSAYEGLLAALRPLSAALESHAEYLPILGYGLFTPDPIDFPGASFDSEASGARLISLLARPLYRFGLAFDRSRRISLCVSQNVLRVIDLEPKIASLPERSGISKEAIAMALGLLTKQSLIEVSGAGRDKQATPTPSGREALEWSATTLAAIEQEIASQVGADRLDGLTRCLQELVDDGSAIRAALTPHPDNWRARFPAKPVLPSYPAVLHRGGYPDGA